MEQINPDDNSLDFTSDITYDPHLDAEGQPLIVEKHFSPSRGISTRELRVVKPSGSYDQALRPLAEQEGNSQVLSTMEDEHYMIRLAQASWLRSGLHQYARLRGGYPVDIREYLTKGFGPIDIDSVNPANGQHYYFDSRPNDFCYSYSAGADSPEVYATDANGERNPYLGF